MSRQWKSLGLWVLALAAVGALAFMGGRTLRGQEDVALAFDLDAPSYAAADVAGGLSLGGFTGFDDVGGVDGRVVVSGRVLSVGAENITLETPTGSTSIRVTAERSLRRLGAGSPSDLATGSTVAVLLDPDTGAAVSVLVLP